MQDKVELFLDEEERSIQEVPEHEENKIEGDGINTLTSRKLGLDMRTFPWSDS